MIQLSATFVAQDSTQREQVSCGIPDAEWDTLISFHQDVERLRFTRFVQNKRGGQISIKVESGKLLTPEPREVNMEEVWAMLMKLRPFVLQKERHYFHKIKNLLKRRLTHSAFRKQINLIDAIFTLQIMQSKICLLCEDRQILSVDMVMDWLNSFEYHQDQGKRVSVRRDLGIWGANQNGTPIVLFALVDMIQAILSMGDFVETLIEVVTGDRDEIVCPSDFLVIQK